MELKLKFKQLCDAGGDACAPYEVILSKESTLRELVDCILKDEREWGGIKIGGWLDADKLEYRYGKIIRNDFTEAELNSTVATVGAYGGWSYTNYWVSLK